MKQRTPRGRNLVEIEELRDGPSLELMLADPLQRPSITVPRVFEEPAGQGPARICWDASETRTISKGLQRPECLVSFIQLHDKPDKEIVRFARRWGVLGVCTHGMPHTHHPDCTPLSYMHREWETEDEAAIWHVADVMVTPERQTWQRFWEPITSWRHYSRQFSAILWVAEALADGRTPSAREWFAAVPWQVTVEYDALVAGEPYPSNPRHTDWTEQNVKRLIARDARDGWEIVDGWLTRLAYEARAIPVRRREVGEARSHWTLSFGQAPVSSPWTDEFRMNSDSLFAVLVAQLGAMVDNPTRIYRCSMCQGLVDREVKRKPKPRERILCSSPNCRRENRKLIRNEAAARRRAREKEQRAMGGGVTPESMLP